jgi:hypothetical protein
MAFQPAEAVHWEKKWDRVLDDSRPPFYRCRGPETLRIVQPARIDGVIDIHGVSSEVTDAVFSFKGNL